MIDFKSSFKKGIAAAVDAEKNKNEIDDVIKELSRQISAETSGKIEIFREESFVKALVDIASVVNGKAPSENFEMINARNPSFEGKKEALCKLYIDQSGYPCKLEESGNVIYCLDQAGLIDGLNEVLQSPEVGEKLHTIMNLA